MSSDSPGKRLVSVSESEAADGRGALSPFRSSKTYEAATQRDVKSARG